MTIDDELLKKAKLAGDALAEAERQVLTSRADYHTSIRRMHLAGGSLREIAEALSISHQRVQQIVDSAGGSWWQRIWRTRNRAVDAVCTFCGRPPSEVDKLIAGPNVYICDACIDSAERRRTAPAKLKCSFCGRRKARPSRTAAARICEDCLHICREILDGRK
jgi:hypothetical protein